MNNVRKEIRDLISINEKIQSALLSGDHITDDEYADSPMRQRVAGKNSGAEAMDKDRTSH